jgi:hypothetical protein
MILVSDELYDDIAEAVETYVEDIGQDGYVATVLTVSGGTPSDLRTLLAEELSSGLKGAFLIGDLPVPWFEMDTADLGHEEFPIDYYYMDLDGIWEDYDDDGLWDYHHGESEPDIWVGRLTAKPCTFGDKTEAELVSNYFSKNHLYRTGQLPLSKRGLMFVDDDWYSWSQQWNQCLQLLYPETVLVNDREETNDDEYRRHLRENYEWIQICAHSSPDLHQFSYGGGHGNFYNYEIPSTDPLALFYNLFACSNSRYVAQNYMGGWYIFTDTHGIATVGSTKTGAMLDFDIFYGPLSEGYPLGEAFQYWMGMVAEQRPDWHYGMTLCGDPLLVMMEGIVHSTHMVDDDTYGHSNGNADGILNPGETIECPLTLLNTGSLQRRGVKARMTTLSPYVVMTDSLEFFGMMDPGQELMSADSYKFRLEADIPDGESITFLLEITDNNENYWSDNVIEKVSSPGIDLLDPVFEDSGGNEDGWPDPGERIDMHVTIVNTGHASMDSLSITLDVSNDDITFPGNGDSIYVGSIAPDDTIVPAQCFTFDITEGFPEPLSVPFMFHSFQENFYHESDTLMVKIGRSDILLVNDDPKSDFELYYTETLDGLGLEYETWRRNEQGPLSNFLSPEYRFIIWYTGNAVDETLDETDRQDLRSFIERGNNTLFVTGQNIGKDIGSTDFYTDVLHAEFVSDNAYEWVLEGREGESISDGLVIAIGGIGGANNQTSPSSIYPTGDAQASFSYQEAGYPGAVTYFGTDCSVIYFAFGFEGINTYADRADVMRRILQLTGIHLLYFTASPENEGIELAWEFSGAMEDRSVELLRKQGDAGTWNTVQTVRGNQAIKSSFIDRSVVATAPGTTLRYTLRGSGSDENGFVEYGSVKVVVPNDPHSHGMEQNFPNPFNPLTTVRFDVGGTFDRIYPVDLTIFNVRGEKVRTLIHDRRGCGRYSVLWNGCNDRNEPLPSGIYFSRLTVGNSIFTKKMLLLR